MFYIIRYDGDAERGVVTVVVSTLIVSPCTAYGHAGGDLMRESRSWRIVPGSQHIGYCVQCGLVSLPMSLLLRMKIWRVRPKKRLRSKFVGAVLWLRFIPVNAHVRGLG